MKNPGIALDNIYKKIGDKKIIFIIFLFNVLIHTILALQMEMLWPEPNDFGVMSWTALFCGNDWSGIMSKIEYYSGYAGSIVYTPLFYIIKEPFTFYKSALILNGIIISIIPVLAYIITGHIGVRKLWVKILSAFACGSYSAVIAYTKFLWDETFCIVIPWILLYSLIKTEKANRKHKKHFMSVLTAFWTIFAYAANPRLFAVSLAVIITVFFSYIFLKKKLVCFTSFIPSLIIFFFLENLLADYLINIMWKDAETLTNTASSFIKNLGSLKNFGETLWGHLYYFSTATWGLSVLGVCLIFTLVFRYCKNNKNNSAYQLVICSVFAFSSNLFSLITSVLDKSSLNETEYQDALIFGRYIDNTLPLLLIIVVCCIALYKLDFFRLLITFVAQGSIYTFFLAFTAPYLIDTGTKIDILNIAGLHPLRIGENIGEAFTVDGLLLTVSCVFSLTALFIVIVCCSEKYRSHIISFCIICVMAYSSIHTIFSYLPYSANDKKSENSEVYKLSENIYDAFDAPDVYAYNLPTEKTALIQFLNRHTKIFLVYEANEIPENCFIISFQKDKNELDKINIKELSATDNFVLYSYGERADAYVLSQNSEEVG